VTDGGRRRLAYSWAGDAEEGCARHEGGVVVETVREGVVLGYEFLFVGVSDYRGFRSRFA